ncbi:hypothetical protein BB559_006125 [Furculomyces boomerangus]|uniref:RNA helicase n=1 Tax=Furculomyces boomerangus TaxID=61424 RepID=A0A2T9Y4L6_9FUNG|nr:hypothetical protein BB559_006125 [Furculomyces boomerangus]
MLSRNIALKGLTGRYIPINTSKTCFRQFHVNSFLCRIAKGPYKGKNKKNETDTTKSTNPISFFEEPNSKNPRNRERKFVSRAGLFSPETDISDDIIAIKRNSALRFLFSKECEKRCNFVGVPTSFFTKHIRDFVFKSKNEKIPRLSIKSYRIALDRDGSDVGESLVMNSFFEYLATVSQNELPRFHKLRSICDLRNIHNFFPNARKLNRKIIMHVGPTNSGKTYQALKKLQEAKSGIYCSPLRLLAHEVYTRMNDSGKPCELITGEDRRPPTAGIMFKDEVTDSSGTAVIPMVSSTIEMVNVLRSFEVAVIDEIQMLQDTQRGFGWTTALLGLQASEIHLCGEETAVPIIKKIFSKTNEDVEVNVYERLSKLTVADSSIKENWKKVKEVIYGGLPPENRSKQAEIFNDPTSGYNVLVASDAVGMGLNLKIKRIIFESLKKFDGHSFRSLSVSQTKQIGGRAGRYNVGYDMGVVTTFKESEMPKLKSMMSAVPDHISAAGILPPTELLERISYSFPNEPLSSVATAFSDLASYTDEYFMCDIKGQRFTLDLIAHENLSLRQFYTFMYAPVSHRDETCVQMASRFAKFLASNTECRVCNVMNIPTASPKTKTELLFHFSNVFTDTEKAIECKNALEDLIQKGLK